MGSGVHSVVDSRCLCRYARLTSPSEVRAGLVTAWGFKPYEALAKARAWRVRFPCTSAIFPLVSRCFFLAVGLGAQMVPIGIF